jgi:hypothetical protein
VFARIRSQLCSRLDARLVDELLAAYSEVKQKYYLGGLRLSEVEGGRFCEAAFRVLEQITGGSFTPLGHSIDSERIIRKLANVATASGFPESVRLHMPRALRVVYDIRNNRDAAHLADGIDPNLQDATLVVAVVDWVLAELLRLYHNVSADEAQAILEAIVCKAVPVVEDFDGFPKVLNAKLASGDCLASLGIGISARSG